MPSLSLLEKAVVLKGFGQDSLVSVQSGLSSGSFLCWHTLTVLFLVDRFCKCGRYDTVLCFHADDSNAYSVNVSVDSESRGKQARFVSLSNPLLTFQQLVNIIEESVTQAIAATSTQNGRVVMAVVVFGFSDLLLRLGLAKSLELLSVLRSRTGRASTCTTVTKCVVLAVNSAMHWSTITERLTELSDTIVTTTNCTYIDTSSSSNSSSGNFAEVYTMRKTTSGRINEDSELFGYDASPAVFCMYPLLDSRIGSHGPVQSKKDNPCEKSGCNDHNHDSDHRHSSNELLVTFDSNDPEVSSCLYNTLHTPPNPSMYSFKVWTKIQTTTWIFNKRKRVERKKRKMMVKLYVNWKFIQIN